MSLLTLLAAILAGSLIFFVAMLLSSFFLKTKPSSNTGEADFINLTSEIEVEEKKVEELDPRSWKGYWYYQAKAAGIRYDSNTAPATIASVLVVIAAAVGFFVIPANTIGGIALPIGALVIYQLYYKSAANKRIKKIELALPNLLAGLRANLQSNMTPDKALQAMAEETEGPLGEELQLFKNDIMLNIPMDEALVRLSERINSSEIKFLIASVRLAIKSGVDLDPQIAIIQRIVTQRGRVKSALAIAIAQVQPVMIITIGIIPVGYLYSVSSSESNNEFWLQSFAGILATFIIVAVLICCWYFCYTNADS
jgi:tight adherence protein B